MSWQAMEAVLLSSRYRHDRGENFTPYRIMMALASFADSAGIIGVAGDAARCPGHRAIADRAGTHRNTVGSWMRRLQDEGELAVVASGGNGRGCWTQYQITIVDAAGIVPITPTMAQDTREDADNNDAPILQQMAHAMREMAQEMAQLRALLAQQNGTNGTMPSPVAVPDPIEIRRDPELDPGGPPTPEPPAAAGTDFDTPPDPNAAYADEMWRLAQVVVGDWLKLVGHYRRLSPQNTAHSADYYAPAVRLVHEFGGDRAAAWTALETAYHGMLHAGMTPRRLAPVVEQVIGNLNRQRSPVPAAATRPQPSANGSGGQQPRAVAALEEFKRRLAQQESDA